MIYYNGFLFYHGSFMNVHVILIRNFCRLNTTNKRKSRIKKFTQLFIFFKCKTICTLFHTTRYFSSIAHDPNSLHQVNKFLWHIFQVMKWYSFYRYSIQFSIPVLYNPIKTCKCPGSKSIIISYFTFTSYPFTQFRSDCRGITYICLQIMQPHQKFSIRAFLLLYNSTTIPMSFSMSINNKSTKQYTKNIYIMRPYSFNCSYIWRIKWLNTLYMNFLFCHIIYSLTIMKHFGLFTPLRHLTPRLYITNKSGQLGETEYVHKYCKPTIIIL